MVTTQLKISISKKLEKKLEAVRKKHDKRTINAIASEVVEDYLDLWDAVEDRRRKILARQHARMLKKLRQKPSRSR